ncbi:MULTISPECIES: alpha/beta hydrolase [unclassified Halomonas]|uniref:alpha/beta hydrolase n=1 Tax=unclassified Halomonas TaxID=2609666 RepID=UPI0005FCA011|nr:MULTISPECIES: alpha/beta hydrolase [unclassified Halomonas]CEP37211.1 Putative uncharacterized protein [Halomonas sp. R57-5]
MLRILLSEEIEMTHRKQAVVLIHGLFGSLNDPKILAEFDQVEVHAPDLIGYGALSQQETAGIDLLAQAEHVAKYILDAGIEQAHIVGHSVGGAIAVLLADRFPELVASLISVEGNLTIKDAFWSAELASMPIEKVEEIVAGYRHAPSDWFASAGVPITEWTSRLATSWLSNQPATTIKAQAKAVVEATKPSTYLQTLSRLIDSGLAVSLIAGSRSPDGWDVPDWLTRTCTMRINIADTGHLMMAESPARFSSAVQTCVAYNKS